MFYTPNGMKVPPVPRDLQPPLLGDECNTDEVSTVAMRKEYSTNVSHLEDDPWFVMSVKDQLEQYHVDGSHTTVKSRTKHKTTTFDKDLAWKEEQEAGQQFTGGGPVYTLAQQAKLDEVALSDKSSLQETQEKEKKVKVGPWASQYIFSKYTIDGSALEEYHQMEREQRVTIAIQQIADEEEIATLKKKGKWPTTGGSKSVKSARSTAGVSSKKSRRSVSPSSPLSLSGRQNSLLSSYSNKTTGLSSASPSSSSLLSSKKSKRKRRLQEEDIAAPVDEFDTMKGKLGGERKVEAIANGFLSLARNITRHTNKQKVAIDTSLDLVEACDKLRIVKVVTLLVSGQGDPNMMTAEDEPLFISCLQRAIRMDQTAHSLRLGEEHKENADRKKLQKVLDQLVKFGAEVNSDEGREGRPAHLIAAADNTKLLFWLAKCGADFNLPTMKREGGMTPLMIATKFNNTQVMAELVKRGVNLDSKNNDGMTALHLAAKYGQSGAALFLLRVGINKGLRDKFGRTAATLAQEAGYPATSQAIAAFSLPPRKAGPQLQFAMDQQEGRVKSGNGGNSRGVVLHDLTDLLNAEQVSRNAAAFVNGSVTVMKSLYHRFMTWLTTIGDRKKRGDDGDEDGYYLDDGSQTVADTTGNLNNNALNRSSSSPNSLTMIPLSFSLDENEDEGDINAVRPFAASPEKEK